MSNDDSLSLIRSIKPITFSYSKQGKDYAKFFSSTSLKTLLKKGIKKIKVASKFQLPVLQESKKVKDDDLVNIKIKSSFKYVTDLSSLKDFHVSSIKKKKITQEYIDKMKLYKELFCITKEKIVDMEFRKKRYEKIKEKYSEFKSYIDKEFSLDPGKYYPKYSILYKRNPVTVFGTAGLKNKSEKFIIKTNDYGDNNLKRLNKNRSADNLSIKKRFKTKSEKNKKKDKDKYQSHTKKFVNSKNIKIIPLSQTVKNSNKYNTIDESLQIENVNSIEFPKDKKLSTSLNFNKSTTRQGLLKTSKSFSNTNKIKCPIVFNKMPGRERKAVVTSGLGNDVDYTPKYDIIRPHVPTTIFKHSFDFSKFKKYINGKIIRNYCYTPDQYFVLEINKKMENINPKKKTNKNKDNDNNKENNNVKYVFI